MTRDEINEWLIETYPDENVMLADGFEDAFIGIVSGVQQEPVACYDRARCIAILSARDGMTEEDAEEFFAFNVEGAWVGDRTPVFLTVFPVLTAYANQQYRIYGPVIRTPCNRPTFRTCATTLAQCLVPPPVSSPTISPGCVFFSSS